jgi:hypothetical protein
MGRLGSSNGVQHGRQASGGGGEWTHTYAVHLRAYRGQADKPPIRCRTAQHPQQSPPMPC